MNCSGYTLSERRRNSRYANVIHSKEVKNRLTLTNSKSLELYKDLQELTS